MRTLTKVMTLFLDFYVEMELESSFKEIGLMEYVLEYDTKNGLAIPEGYVEFRKATGRFRGSETFEQSFMVA